MKSLTALALGLTTAFAVPAALADDHHDSHGANTGTTSTTTSQSTGSTIVGADGTTTYTQPTYTAPTTNYAATTTTTTTTTDDMRARNMAEEDRTPRVTPGFGLNVFGAAGTKESARLGLGGRIEFVMPFGLTLGGSYTQHFTNEANTTAVRPLLGEIGVAIPIVRRLELRPMVGIGYAFASGSSDTSGEAPGNGNAAASASVATSGFDVAPGAKISYLPGGVFEVYTLPKYHFISGNNFLGVELGAGARF